MAASSSSRTPYVAGTPEIPHFRADRDIALASFQPKEDSLDSAFLGESLSRKGSFDASQWTRLKRRLNTFMNDNAGLLLIACSQGFGSFMITAVKMLNSMDPPVPPLEVSDFSIESRKTIN